MFVMYNNSRKIIIILAKILGREKNHGLPINGIQYHKNKLTRVLYSHTKLHIPGKLHMIQQLLEIISMISYSAAVLTHPKESPRSPKSISMETGTDGQYSSSNQEPPAQKWMSSHHRNTIFSLDHVYHHFGRTNLDKQSKLSFSTEL